ncbi:hypothetical protein [Persephonella sp.]
MEVKTHVEVRELEQMKKQIQDLELKIMLLERAVEFLAKQLDDTDSTVGLIPNNEYLLKHILQK